MGESRAKQYIAIDLKSFYASVECSERGLDPLTTNLVVADVSRTEKTICLAVSPSLKAYGIPGRARLFEVLEMVRGVNARRRAANHGRPFTGKSSDSRELGRDPSLQLDFIAAAPHMALYMKRSAEIYQIYLKYIAPEDIHVYSIDEVFMDVTGYLHTYGMSAHDLAMKMIHDVLAQTGITATAGIGTNLYLAKVAMDVVAKHIPADADGVRIAELDEMSYRRKLWAHEPLTDFWRVGRGYARKLNENGLATMGDIARCSLGGPGDYHNEDLLYRLFGVNAELLIDHAWGFESATIADIKSYRPDNRSIGQGQVLHCPYTNEKARLIVREMTDLLVLDLVDKKLVTDEIVLYIGYDTSNLSDPSIARKYHGPVTEDRYGRKVQKHANGSVRLGGFTSSTKIITEKVMDLFTRITDPMLLVRRVNISAEHVKDRDAEEKSQEEKEQYRQMDFFADFGGVAAERRRKEEEKAAAEHRRLEKERRLQEATLAIQKKYGKNALIKGMNLEEGATTIDRNGQIGGHRA